MTTPPSTFTKKESVDKPGIIGARWWQESIATQVSRRRAMNGLLAFGGVLAGMATLGTCAYVVSKPSGPSPDDVTFQPKNALDMQKEYGWNFGATSESLVFDGKSTQPFDRTALERMVTELAPAEARHTPHFVSTLFQSLTAVPKTTPAGESSTSFTPVKDALTPIATPGMTTAFEQGMALAALLEKEPRAKDVAVIVDLVGPEAVAFAAGAASVLDPVFLFDNWPHPRAVVPAHLTLAAAAYYQPLFAKARGTRASAGSARPMFVLDRKRLASYTDDAAQFDNRHTARLPTAENLSALGTKNVLYIAPNAIDRKELDDLVETFIAWSKANIAIKIAPATAFGSGLYGSSPTANQQFWTHWSAPPSDLATNEVKSYTPVSRATPFSSGRPTGFGMVPVAVAVGTGVILGAKLSRSGSWNRTTSGSSGS